MKINVLISQKEIEKRVAELAKEISKDYDGEKIHLVCVLKGGAFLTCQIAKDIESPVTFDFISVSSYGDDFNSSGNVKIIHDLTSDIKDKNVIIVEDIIDTGITLDSLVRMFKQRDPKSIEICTLLDKPDKRTKDIKVKYVGFEIPNKFVIGYGLDYKQEYRNLPYIGVVENIPDK